ncbi:Proliferating cell nuclear antigen [Aphelenchoides bicaudatus]|nr:Proliferating cell nuclear antigen [Aphelenchoides bicaudatus]
MFEAKLAKASLLKKLIDSIKELVNDAPFDCSEQAMCLQAMDGSHVALVTMKLGIGLFDAYRCDRTLNLGLSMKNMAVALKCAGNDDTCLIRYDDSENENVVFTFTDEKNRRKQDITLKLMDIDSEHLGVPDQKYSAVIDMSSAEFQKVVTDLTPFSDTISISASKGTVVFEASGNENGGNVVTYTSEDEVQEDMGEDEEKNEESGSVQITVTEDVKLSFSIKYMTQFAKATKLSNRVRLSMSNRVPIVVEYPIEDDGHLKFYLAPKIEDEADDMDECSEKSTIMNKLQRAFRLLISVFIIYFLLGCVAYVGNLWQMPRQAPRDFGFQKKAILRDEVLDDEFQGAGAAHVIKKAVLLEPNLQMPEFIDPNEVVIKEYNSSAIKSLEVDKKLLEKIKSKAKEINEKHKFILYTLINNAYLNLTLNWLCNSYVLEGPSIHEKVLIVALDKSTCLRINRDWPKVACIPMEADKAYNQALDWGSSGYARILWARIQQVYALVEAKLQLVIFETDALWLKNPINLFQKAFDTTTHDITIPRNYKETNGQKYAFDPMIIRPSYMTKQVLGEIRERVRNDTKVMDQDILNEKCSKGDLKCIAFSWDEVADGKWFKMSARERKAFQTVHKSTMKVLFLLLLIQQVAESYKFLLYNPKTTRSHVLFINKIADVLVDGGHEVVIYMPEAEKNFGSALNHKRARVIERPMDFEPLISISTPFENEWEVSENLLLMWSTMKLVSEQIVLTCKHQIQDDKLIELLRKEKFDVGMSELMDMCSTGIFEKAGINKTIMLHTATMDSLISMLGVPSMPSYNPSTFVQEVPPISFFGRVKAQFVQMFVMPFMSSFVFGRISEVLAQNGVKTTFYGSFGKASYLFINTDEFVNFPAPTSHKMVDIAGVGLEKVVKRNGQLDKKLQSVFDNSKLGVIYISFGSVAKSFHMPAHLKKVFVEAIKQFPDVDFIWKYEKPEDETIEKLPNLHLHNWLPQTDILAQKKLIAFLSHGGMNSITEATYIGAPLICIPLFTDQPRNALMVKYRKTAIVISKHNITKESLVEAFQTMVTDKSYYT